MQIQLEENAKKQKKKKQSGKILQNNWETKLAADKRSAQVAYNTHTHACIYRFAALEMISRRAHNKHSLPQLSSPFMRCQALCHL